MSDSSIEIAMDNAPAFARSVSDQIRSFRVEDADSDIMIVFKNTDKVSVFDAFISPEKAMAMAHALVWIAAAHDQDADIFNEYAARMRRVLRINGKRFK